MNKKTLESLVEKKTGDTRVVSVRVPEKTLKKLEKKGIKISTTVKNVLERLAE